MNEAYYYSEEIDLLLEDYRKILRELQNEATEEKLNKSAHNISFINERIKTAKDAYFIEVKNFPSNEQSNYVGKIKAKMVILENLNMEYEFLKGKVLCENNEKRKNAIRKEKENEKFLSPQEIEIRGDLIQDKTQESINRMKKMVHESEQITKDANEKLTTQNEKLMEVADKVDDVELNVSHAKQTIREIAKGAITDRLIRFLVLSVVLAAIALIAVIAIPRPK